MAIRNFRALAALSILCALTGCGEDAPSLSVAAEEVPGRAVYFVLHDIDGREDVKRLSGTSFGISRYRLGAVTALIGARIVNDDRAKFLQTENQKVAETKLCLATKNSAGGCPRYLFEMAISRSNDSQTADKRGIVPIQPVLKAEGDILQGVQVFHCKITEKQQICLPLPTRGAKR